ncbi:hypothetical protein CS542_00735 [Pedobacter sp. IW39]|nr:hypothetical protein CS542_00735 [Pedobacter sp. IW39]
MSAYTSSSAYAVQNGKPVVCLYSGDFKDNSRPFLAEECLDVVNWFKSSKAGNRWSARSLEK